MGEIAKSVIHNIIVDISKGDSLARCFKTYNVSSWFFFKAIHQDAELSNLYIQAQQARSELLVDEIIDIADTEIDPQRARNRIDARRWYASKMKPDKFGDRIDLNINAVVDVSSALLEARQRAAQVIDAQYRDITQDSSTNATGLEPVAIPRDAPKKSPPDIFD